MKQKFSTKHMVTKMVIIKFCFALQPVRKTTKTMEHSTKPNSDTELATILKINASMVGVFWFIGNTWVGYTAFISLTNGCVWFVCNPIFYALVLFICVNISNKNVNFRVSNSQFHILLLIPSGMFELHFRFFSFSELSSGSKNFSEKIVLVLE